MGILMWIFVFITVVVLIIKYYYKFVISGRCKSKAKLDGKTVIITGASAGIGKETAKDLASRGARVILACRNREKAQRVADDIIRSTGNCEVVVRELDVSNLASVRKFAKEILDKESHIHILINNAGTGGTPNKKEYTEEGLELVSATNHYGHFLLTNILLDRIKSSSPSRIINVSSIAHKFNLEFTIDDPFYKKVNDDYLYFYCDSKLHNILFTTELARKLDGTGVTVNSLHPGTVNTEIVTKMGSTLKLFLIDILFFRLFGKDEKLGAQTTIHLAVSEEVENVTGKYFVDCKESDTSPMAQDSGLAKKFWEVSEDVVKLAPEETCF